MNVRILRPAMAAALVLGVAVTATGQSVDAIVEKNLNARGGAEKLKSVDAMRLTGRLSAGGMEMPLTIIMKRPNLVRQEMAFQGQTMIQAFDGEKAWAVNPMMGSTTPQEIRGPQRDMLREQSDFDGPLVDYKQKGHTVELEGEDTVDGTKAVKLKVTRKSGLVQRLWLDAQTWLEMKSAVEMTQAGQPITIESLLGNYQDVNGLEVPFTMQTVINGRLQARMTIENVDLAPTLAPDIFTMPK